jgi:DNA-binding CsgD family transcriptional regulator
MKEVDGISTGISARDGNSGDNGTTTGTSASINTKTGTGRLGIFAPNVASFGYGLFLAVNATSVWGGAFPLLPMEIQSFGLLATFSLAQSAAFCCAFLLGILGAYRIPQFTRHIPVTGCTALLFGGSLSLIAPLYIPGLTVPLVITGGVFLGVGSAGFLVLWQRAFASQEADRGGLDIIMGTGISALIYVGLHTIPIAVAAFMIAFVFVPLSGLCLILASRSIDYRQPMFADEPRRNRQVYRLARKNLWRSALCVGSLTFLDGVTRALALDDPASGTVVNLLSMGGALVASFVLIFLWRRYSFRFDTMLSFRTIFPLVVTSLLALPFLGTPYLQVFSGLIHMFSTFAVMIMMIQCAQTSRNNGIDPVFIYGFLGLIVAFMQSCGFLSGYASALFLEPGLPQFAIVALFSTWLLAVVLHSVRGHIRLGALDLQGPSRVSSIEFIALEPEADGTGAGMAEGVRGLGEGGGTGAATSAGLRGANAAEGVRAATGMGAAGGTPGTRAAAGTRGTRGAPVTRGTAGERPAPSWAQWVRQRKPQDPPPEPSSPGRYRDRLAKQCVAIAHRYRLSAREAEIAEFIARGNSVAHIAKTLVISENTVRFHSKNLYMKLGIHKRQDLVAMLEETD